MAVIPAARSDGFPVLIEVDTVCLCFTRFDPHAAPDPTPLWNILDWTPGGRGTDWHPKLDYGADA